MSWDHTAQLLRAGAHSKAGEGIKLNKCILRGDSSRLKGSLKSPCRKEVKGQTGAPRRPGVPVGRKLHKALHGHGSREKRWEVKGSKRASPGFTAAHIEAAGETVKWTHPQGGRQRKDKNVFKEVRKLGGSI